MTIDNYGGAMRVSPRQVVIKGRRREDEGELEYEMIVKIVLTSTLSSLFVFFGALEALTCQ